MSYGKTLEHRRERVQGREEISEEVNLFQHGLILDMREEEARAKDEVEYQLSFLDFGSPLDNDFNDEPFDCGSDFDDNYDNDDRYEPSYYELYGPLFNDDVLGDFSYAAPLRSSFEDSEPNPARDPRLADLQKETWLSGGDPAEIRRRRFAGKDVIR